MEDREWKAPIHPTKKITIIPPNPCFSFGKMPIIRFEGCFIITLRQMFHISKDKEISKK